MKQWQKNLPDTDPSKRRIVIHRVVSAFDVQITAEALGLPTNVDAPHTGTVEDVLVTDGSPVEYGQPLVVLRRTHAA